MATQGFFEFFNELNAYWVAPLVNVSFVVVAFLAQLFLSSPWGTAVSNESLGKGTDPKSSSSIEEQQLLPEALTSRNGVQNGTANSTRCVPVSANEGHHASVRHNASQSSAQVELSHVSLTPDMHTSMPRRRSQPHLPLPDSPQAQTVPVDHV